MQRIAALVALTSLVALLVPFPSAEAEAGDRIIVFDFKGKGAAIARNEIVNSITKKGYSVVAQEEVNQWASDMGYTQVPDDPAVCIKIAEAAGAEGFISGELKTKGKRKRLTLSLVVVCEKGVVRHLKYEWVAATIPPSTVALAVDQLDNEIKAAMAGCPKPVPPPTPAEPPPSETLPTGKEKKKWTLGREEDGGRYCKMGGMRCGLPPAVVAHIGLLVSSRDLKIRALDGSRYRYEGAGYPLVGLEALFNIGRFFAENPKFCPGLAFSFAHSFLLVSHPLESPEVTLETKDQRVGIEATLEVTPSPEKIPLQVIVGLGWGLHNYLVQSGPNFPYIADFKYHFINLGLGLRVAAVRRWLDVAVHFDGRFPYKMGHAEKFYGAEAKRKFGFSAGARLSGVVIFGLHWSFGFDWIMYTSDFEGDGSIEAGGYASGDKSKDSFPTGYFMLGYRF